MKCVKNTKTGVVRRVSDRVAGVLVASSIMIQYVCKQEWKEGGRKR